MILSVRLAVEPLFKEGVDRSDHFVRALEIYERYILFRVRQLVAVLLEVIVAELARPVDHRLVLVAIPVVLPLHLLVNLVILKEASDVLAILRQLGVSEEIEPVLIAVADEL